MAFLYGLYKVGKEYVTGLLKGRNLGTLISRHSNKELAERARATISRATRDSGPPGSPGVTYGGGTRRSAIVGQQRVRDYTKSRRIEGAVAGAGAGAVAGAGATTGVNILLDRINTAKKENAATASLKKQFINAVKSKTDDPKKIAQARLDFDKFMAGSKRSLNFNYGGMVKKTRKKRKK